MASKPQVLVVIPARWASTRFPGKPLADLLNKPMIQWVAERASQAPSVSGVIVATDDEKIADAVRDFGGNAVMTGKDHESGSDRIAEVVADRPCDIVVNVQGDEPLIPPQNIEQVVQCLIAHPDAPVSTLMAPMDRYEDVFDSNVVKVVTDKTGRALYFTRSPVPFHREAWQDRAQEEIVRGDLSPTRVYRHIGLYAYTRSFLLEFTQLPPSPLEQAEKLEQLRILENGFPIQVALTDQWSMGVDQPEDLDRVRERLRELKAEPSCN